MNNKNGPGSVNYSIMSKYELLKLVDKGSILLNEWTEAVIMIGAELFIVCPHHEIFKDNYFSENTKMLILERAIKMLEVCKYKRVIYEDNNNSFLEVQPENITKIVEKYKNSVRL